MKERPILFRAPMVRAILDGTKTQTRRAIKWPAGYVVDHESMQAMASRGEDGLLSKCPYGQPGDRLWVRETFSDVYGPGGDETERKDHVMYRADGEADPCVIGDSWTPSIHMPRWASRITLEVTGVRVERLQEISEADAKAEGAPFELGELERLILGAKAKYRSGFVRLWESINGSGSWGANPWVWVVEFQRLAQPTPTTPTGGS